MNTLQCHFWKITETARCKSPQKAVYSELSIAFHSTSKAGMMYTTELAIVRTELRAWEASSFCDFTQITSCDITLFYSFWMKQT